jgi:UDP-GlcNAc3NAcA epimerase
MKKILTVLGARPQFIKASIVSRAIEKSSTLTETLVHTGQHFDKNMSNIFFTELGVREPDYFLDIHGGSHAVMTSRMLAALEPVMINESPDIVLVYGDTNSTLAAALTAVKLHIPVAHIEAGLRSFNFDMPEEINRVLTDRISHWLFTPTDNATQHLRREGFAPEQVIQVGDVMYDVALYYSKLIYEDKGLLTKLKVQCQNYILCTIHRAENVDSPERLLVILDVLKIIAKEIPVVFPMHPRTRDILKRMDKLENLSKYIKVIEPVGYLDMVQLEKFSALIVTDSGGVQKEAFFYQIPCVTLRDETEWVELLDAGWNHLAPLIDTFSIVAIIRSALGTRGKFLQLYGQGDAAMRIIEAFE